MTKNIENPLAVSDNIQNKIHAIRGIQVILDRDLAPLYQTDTRSIKQAVKRNIERFPNSFMFELTDEEIDFLVSQSVIPSKKYFGGSKPFVFTEQGVSMLSAVLRSKVAVEMSIKIINSFVRMRRFIALNEEVFSRLERLENFKRISSKKLEKILTALENKTLSPQQGIFYNGQMFDAHLFILNLIKRAQESIVLLDNYVDENVLQLFSKVNKGIKAVIYTKNITDSLKLDLKRFNDQYDSIEIKLFSQAHDRFLIIDQKDMYHIGASLKDLGKKWFAFSKMSVNVDKVIRRLQEAENMVAS